MKKVFRTDDGREFGSETQAETHQDLMNAKYEYESAKRGYAKKLWESQKTADGYLFQLGVLHTYYQVVWFQGRLPAIKEVDFFYIYNCDLDSNDDGVILRKDNSSPYGYVSYRIDELYWLRKNAELRLIEHLDEYLGEIHAKIEELRVKLDIDV